MKTPYSKPLLMMILLGFGLSLVGQIFNQNTKDLISSGDRYFTKGQYGHAETVYAQINRDDPGNSAILRRLGVVKVFNRKYLEAIDILDPLVKESDSIDYFVAFQLAKAYHQTRSFKNAVAMYKLASADSAISGQCEIGIMQTELARKMQRAQSKNMVVKWLDSSINTAGHELAPYLLNDTLLIYNTQPTGSNFTLPFFDNKLSELRYATLQKGDPARHGIFEILGRQQVTGNSDWIQMDAVIGKNKYVYRSLSDGKIGLSDYSNNDSIVEGSLGIDFLDPGAASVAILPEKDVAYYIKSEEQHGLLQKDIYHAIRDSVGNWVEIGRLDEPVNSVYNEDFLFWCEEEQALYFSSDRKMGTVGGFDIFRSEMDKNGKLQEPVNMGFPVNTPTDDIYYIKSDTLAFYASFNGNNRFDLYSITYQKEAPTLPPPKPWYEKYTDLPGVQQIDKWVSCEHFYFETSQTMPDTGSKSYKTLYKALIDNPGLKVKLTGYADWTGDSLLNKKISYARASNLFFALCMDGVNSEQLKLDFQGSSRLRTKNHFKNKKLYSLAKAANRCVTAEVIDHGGTYLYVAENPDFEVVLQDDSNNRFAIMLNISENRGDDFNQPISDTLQYSVINQLQIMHTKVCSKLPKVANLKNKYETAFPGTYIFCLCQ